jgi:FtsZ-interacting cell division protein YlmF
MGLMNFIRNGITIQKDNRPAAPNAVNEAVSHTTPAEPLAAAVPQKSIGEDKKMLASTILYSAQPQNNYVTQPAPFTSQMPEPQNNFGSAFQSAFSGQTIGNNNILVITPQSKDDIMKIAKSLGDGNSCIITLASITEPQRHLDFLEGFLCASGGTIQQIDVSKYVLTPKGVSIRS